MDVKKKVICVLFAVFFAAGFLLCLFLPKETYSASERRKLAPMPLLSLEALWSGQFMKDFEAYTTDAFPFREQFRRMKALSAKGLFFRQDKDGLYVWDDFIATVEYPLNEDSLNRAAERFQYIHDKYLTEENRVYLSVIPDKNRYLAQESGHLSLDYERLEKIMAQKADFAQYIAIGDLLDKEDYYRTDTHWRQEKILDVAERLAQAMDAPIAADYALHTLDKDFYGVYYGQAALPLPPDQLNYLTGEAIDECSVYDWENQMDIPVYNMDKASGRDPYEMFLSGSLSLVTIKNPEAREGKKLVMFRDSFGSSLAPLLVSGYSQITLVDIRYIHPDLLEKFVDFEGADVLFLYSALTLNHSETLK